MAAAPPHEEHDRIIAALRAEVADLKAQRRAAAEARPDPSDTPLLGRGIHGGFLGGLQALVGAFALCVLFAIFHQMSRAG